MTNLANVVSQGNELDSVIKTNIPSDVVTKYASLVKENLFCSIDTFHELNDLMKRRLQDFLVLNFPILELTRDSQTILINVHEIVLDPHLFEILLAFNKPPKPTKESSTITKNSSQNNTKTNAAIGLTNKIGRKPLYMKFQSLLQSATDFIKPHSFEAHNRRRETTSTGTGVSLKDLHKHLLQNVRGLKEHGISRDTIHHSIIPPRKSNR